MKLKDILELGTYGYDENSTVEIFDMDDFETAIEQDQFTEILIPSEEDAEIYPYAFVLNGTTLIAMKCEEEN